VARNTQYNERSQKKMTLDINQLAMFETEAVIRYSPQTLGDHVSPNWWVIADCDPAIGKYYRNLYYLSTYKTKKIQKPAWKEHVTIVRNEAPVYTNYWEKYEGKNVKIWVAITPRHNNTYFWLDVFCNFFNFLRMELGLSYSPVCDFHLTVGNSKF